MFDLISPLNMAQEGEREQRSSSRGRYMGEEGGRLKGEGKLCCF